jgi:hypothetical protein
MKHGRSEIELTHIGSIRITEPWPPSSREICFHISAVYFLRWESGAVSYTDPAQVKELFSLAIPSQGRLSFSIHWATEYNRHPQPPGATVHAGYCASFQLKEDDRRRPDELIPTLKDVLGILSVLFRQAITLHGWTLRSATSKVSHWIDPIEPNYAPGQDAQRGDFVPFPDEFKQVAEELIGRFTTAEPALKNLIRHLSVAVAPHIERNAAHSFTAMFSALERAIDYVYSRATKAGPSSADSALIKHLRTMRAEVEQSGIEEVSALLLRIDGFIETIRSGRPSFGRKLQVLLEIYPALRTYTADLWPIQGSRKEPGFKEIRNSLSHVSEGVNHQSLAVAGWHLSILLERLVCVLLEARVPKGIAPRSTWLSRNGWYEHQYWDALRRQTFH